ncbi:hypothetical protein AVEN_87795-1 [Araneus ventricosus]|uniref:Uncharacterized protein n=1 Tax=Araneus ventricosus TaxID=182803 RepID=A0A4Y2BDJ6_ARAVE|nr:hypothetical protein AVEN_87795-1 [Araneus ventricosus]
MRSLTLQAKPGLTRGVNIYHRPTVQMACRRANFKRSLLLCEMKVAKLVDYLPFKLLSWNLLSASEVDAILMVATARKGIRLG